MLRIAVQSKGRLYEDTMALLEEADIKLSTSKRTLLTQSSNFPVEVLFLRDDDIPQCVASGIADVGVVGENEFVERAEDADIIQRLGFSKCRLSLAIPGAGQIYNHKYWKLPIIYGGFVGCIYALTWNGQMYKDYSQAYQDIMSDNPANDSYMDFLPLGYTQEDVFNQLSYFQDLFQRRKDVYRRQRDLSIFAFIGVYLLSVVDAYVDAELSNFDISNDLSMTWQPAIFNDPHRGLPQGIGLRCSINF